jgi:hypothetical protein
MKTLAKLTWIEVKLFAREPIAVVFAFAFPLVVLLVLAGVFGSEPNPDFGGVAGSTITYRAIWRWSSPRSG